jgi:rubrerythrin
LEIDMPVLTLVCPQGGHEFRGLVLEGTKPPEVWECSKCGSNQVAEKQGALVQEHPWENRSMKSVCPCCGL